MKLSQIASALNARLENGPADTEITGLNGIEQAGPGEITFVANPKYAAAARLTRAAAVIVAEDFPADPGGDVAREGSLPELSRARWNCFISRCDMRRECIRRRLSILRRRLGAARTSALMS